MPKSAIADITVGDRHRQDMGDLEELADSIKRQGVLQPIGVTADDELVFGKRRLLACRDILGWDTIDCRVVDVTSLVEGEHDENLMRKDFTLSERHAIHEAVRQEIGNRQGQRHVDSCPQVEPGEKTRDVAARRSGLGSSANAARVGRVVDRGEPELIKAMDEGSISPNLAEKVAERPASDQRRIALADSPKAEVKKINRAKKLEKLAESTAAAAKELGTKQYAVIYADPPWRFEPYSRETGMDRSADNHYQTMTTAEIADLDVPGAEHKDCILLLWATAPMLQDALYVMRSWGFDYKSCAVWVKPKAGTGYWFRNRHELLLLDTRGSPPLPETASPSVFEAEAGRHSEKPAEVRAWIDKTWPALPKLEMFARKSAPGWDSWGNEND